MTQNGENPGNDVTQMIDRTKDAYLIWKRRSRIHSNFLTSNGWYMEMGSEFLCCNGMMGRI